MSNDSDPQRFSLDVNHPIWERFFTVAPLVVVGSRESTGEYNLAPKHMAMPLSWENHFGFICTPSHGTYHNVKREGSFTVSFPNPSQVVLTSLAASPRCDDDSKPALTALPTVPAEIVDGVLLQDAYLHLECRLNRIIDGFGENCLIAGTVVAARVLESALRMVDRDDQEIIFQSPLLAYLSPGRYAMIDRSSSFPFPAGFRRAPE